MRRLIVSIELDTIESIDNYHKGNKSWSMGNWSEFVRLAIEEKLLRGSHSIEKNGYPQLKWTSYFGSLHNRIELRVQIIHF